ncbi:MAG: glutamine amidotransferase-related protein [Akkermansia sp.]
MAHKLYGKDSVTERHRHRYEFNPAYRDELENAGLVISAVNDEHGLVEVVELPEHPFFIACQYHPVPVRSQPGPPALFGLVSAAGTQEPLLIPSSSPGPFPEFPFRKRPSFQACSRTFSSSSSTFWLSSA